MASIAATLAIVAPAAARTTLLDDDAPVLRRGLAAGLHVSGDDLFQIRVGEAVLGPGRELESVPASSLLGRSASGIAAALRKAVADASGHAAVIDEIGAAFRGGDGDALAAALTSLAGEPAPYPGGGTMAGRVRIYLAADGGPLLSDPATLRLRTALGRSGGIWMKTRGWTPAQWLTWPAEAQRQASAAEGRPRARPSCAMVAGDQAAQWTRAKNGSACAARQRPGRLPRARLHRGVHRPVPQRVPAALVREGGRDRLHRRPAAAQPGASALVTSWSRETTGLQIPPGGLVTPPLVAGSPRR